MRILCVASEMVPLAKTGGLGDVTGALPPALARAGARVVTYLPCYRTAMSGVESPRTVLSGLKVPLGDAEIRVNLLEGWADRGTPVYLVEREDLFDRPNLYGAGGEDYYDNLERFTVFCHAVLMGAAALDQRPDIVHCHDWQTGLIPALLKGPYAGLPGRAAVVFTIHNLGYQGLFPLQKFPLTGLDPGEFLHPEGLEFWGNISLLKSGILYADAVTTVSPTYAREIRTREYGMGMEGVLNKRARSLHGILNGGDYERWNPANDPHLPARYDLENSAGKSLCKESLLAEMGLSRSLRERPLLGVVSRLDTQKGLDLVLEALPGIMEMDVGLALLGSGDRAVEDNLREMQARYAGKMAVKLGFDDALAHRIMAGADILGVPSRYEPCGLTQIYALKYGTVPLVRATGGLEDTIQDYEPATGRGNGFKFKEAAPGALLEALQRAVDLYGEPPGWERIRRAGMEADYSWDRSAGKYIEIFEHVTANLKKLSTTREEPLR